LDRIGELFVISSGHHGKDPNKDPTNSNLVKLFGSIGYRIKGPEDSSYNKHGLFFTNVVLCLKEDPDMSKRLLMEPKKKCARNFLKPLIKLIKPKVVIALGKVYEPISLSFGISRQDVPKSVKEAVEKLGGFKLESDIVMFPVFHCGHNGYRNRKLDLQERDWQRIKNYLESRHPEI
jgi:uracil-DNA glycosylase